MKYLFIMLFVIGDCVILTSGVFKGSYWTITAVNDDGTYDLKDKDWTLPKVRGSYIRKSEIWNCKDN